MSTNAELYKQDPACLGKATAALSQRGRFADIDLETRPVGLERDLICWPAEGLTL